MKQMCRLTIPIHLSSRQARHYPSLSLSLSLSHTHTHAQQYNYLCIPCLAAPAPTHTHTTHTRTGRRTKPTHLQAPPLPLFLLFLPLLHSLHAQAYAYPPSPFLCLLPPLPHAAGQLLIVPLPMAVQAQHPMADLRNKAAQVPGLDISSMDARAFLAPIPFQGNLLGDSAMQQAIFMGSSSPIDNMQRITQQGVMLPSFPMYQAPIMPADLDAPMAGSKRRRKEPPQSRQNNLPKYQLQLGVDLNQTSGCSPASLVPLPGAQNNVSTGLRLAFDDDHSTVTSSRPDSSSSLALKDELSAQLSQHQEELNQLIKAQAEQLQQALEDRAQRQSKGFLAAVERGLSQRLREKDAEMERVTKRNMELEEAVKQLSIESQMWQTKAKTNEAMVAMLRTNLQQAMLLQHHGREQQSRLEGCGDSEVDDAASLYIDENPHAQQMRAMASLRKTPYANPSTGIMKVTPQSSMMPDNDVAVMRVCRRCKLREATVVFLPCLHLSLCASCKDEFERCPVCSSLKSASVEVLLS